MKEVLPNDEDKKKVLDDIGSICVDTSEYIKKQDKPLRRFLLFAGVFKGMSTVLFGTYMI